MKNKTIPFLFFLLISCSASTHSTDTARIALSSEPPTLDWNIASDSVSQMVLTQLMEGLTQYDEDLNPIPAIAESWDVSDDGRTYIFHLNKNYKWSDGIPVTAHDFHYSWLRLLNPKTASEYAYFLYDIVNAQAYNAGKITDANQVGIKVIDDLTLEIKLTKPLVFFPSLTTFMVTFPLRKDVVAQYGDNWTKHMITCGPYILKEWWHEYRLNLEINPHYGGTPKPKLEKLIFYIIPDPQTSLALFAQNEIDFTPLPAMALTKYQNDPEHIFKSRLRGYYFGFNITKPPFDNPKARQAMAHALDKSVLPDILRGGEQPVNSWIPPGMFGFDDTIGLKFDIQKANELKNAAHFDNKIELVFNSDALNKKVAEWAQEQWKKNLGIEVELVNREWKTYLSELNHDPPPLYRLGWGADYPDPDNFMNLFTSVSGNNHSFFKNPEYDQLIAQAASEPNLEKRKDLYDRIQKILLEDEAVIIPLFIPAQHLLVKSRLRPFPLLPLDYLYWKNVGTILK